MAKHALLSASGAHRWLLCTPSAQLEQKFPASTSAYAEEGTVAHALAELTTRYFLGELDEVSYENQIKSEFEPNSYYNAEMRECAVAYAKFVTGRLAEAKKTCPDAMIILETRLDFSKYVPGGFGTGDCVIIAEPILDVIDFTLTAIQAFWSVLAVEAVNGSITPTKVKLTSAGNAGRRSTGPSPRFIAETAST